MRGDRANLLAYVLLTVMALWALANRFAPDHGPVAECRVGYVYDGDTVEMLCGGEKLTARIMGLDTPETKSPRCAYEAAWGAKATEALRALIKTAPVQIFRHGHDKYRRDLIVLLVGGRDVADTLIAAGLAHPYDGGKRAGWCD